MKDKEEHRQKTVKEMLPAEMSADIEVIARAVHEEWAKNRLADGWRYGEERDDTAKQTPCLVPYDELPEREREYDRMTAAATINAMLGLGYKIILPDR